ncbi:hypothetical protein GLOIN_2v1493585 [Rhizophagus irregularis DAOM 181602=DAOM 197198]|uniref:Uncharacterized protein n=1 Tax=Rhizophagus irregularis (strain DAOM 181602 / DAOM 197198 / MUCL 43194) TaxID=747089 RepID=A0A2P4QYU8_RHIID|nr:hypothetical protein GLOIN_2v1493585 [Rhizophagus irregularis DAOM 181602=DAOM 197198]POG82775.1 hypothetical protein GLOIN_2v1493585 [Rhizophagus irregularis DAOM 181602=DAOM 197198]|eukprot:XP_025189641.1 hypothetical protein GLOIN_2v1493585 [Rhizophagus irregularis DAOM 181602=DAOM 197198]
MMKKLKSKLKKQMNIEEQIFCLLEIVNQFIHKLVILLNHSINLQKIFQKMILIV